MSEERLVQRRAHPGIAVLLPYAESFGLASAGAIALGVRDVTAASRFRHAIRIYGKPVGEPFAGLDFQGLRPALRPLLGRNLGLAERFRRELRGRRDLLVEVHNRPNVFHYLTLTSPNLPLAIRLGNDPLSMRHGRTLAARRRILRHARAVYCVSEFVRRRFLAGLDDTWGKVHVVYNGIPRTLARPPEKEKLVLFVGRVIEGKGVHHVVDALKAVLPRHPDWRAEIIGASRPGAEPTTPFEENLRARCAGLGDAVRWRSFLPNPDVLDHFRRAAIALVPSLVIDALPRTAVEALAYGCAVIGYDTGGLAEVVQGRGIVLEEKSPDRLGQALERLIADEPLRTHLQRRAWEDYPFGLAETTARFDRVRETILEQIERNARRA